MHAIVLFVGMFQIVSFAQSPPQTPVQKQVLARALAQAKPASAQADPVVLALFDSPSTRKYLQQLDDGSGLFKLPALELVQRFWAAIEGAELVHAFGDTDPHAANCGFDLTLAIAQHSPIFWNQWQLQALKYVAVDTSNNRFTETSETELFDFPPFKNVSDPDMETATDRIVYGAVNMYRGSGGNPQCGPVSAILNRTYVMDANILAAPMDTGFYSGSCDNFSSVAHLGNETVGVCMAWGVDKLLGNPPYLSHLLQPYLEFWNQSTPVAGAEYVNLNLARLLTRLLSRHTYNNSHNALPLNFVENALGYFEFNIAVGIELPQGVKMMVGMFELLWGTDQGNLLRAWCIEQGWPLAWAYNPLMSFWRCGTDGKYPECTFPPSISQGIDSASARVLDPWVLSQVSAGHNVSTPSESITHFEQLWQATNASIANRTTLQGAWTTVSEGFPQFAVEPVFAGGCEEECAGILVQSQTCVCSLSR